jgi:hypothetical protein
MCTNAVLWRGGHLVNRGSSPHLTLMSFSVKIPDKLISATQSGNPTRPGRIPAPQNLIPPRHLLRLTWRLNYARSQLARFRISPRSSRCASIRPSNSLLWNILQTKLTLTPIRVSLLAPIPALASPDFSFRFLRPFKSWHPRMTNKLG